MNLILLTKRSRHAWITAAIFSVILLAGWIGLAPRPAPPGTGIVPPANAKPLCTVPSTLFKSWFTSGTVTLNGPVNPANSITFNTTPNCNFYDWAEQMFLWVTSPAPKNYGGGGHIFNSPVFFDVTPPDSLGNRQLIPHIQGFISSLAVRVAQIGPHGLQTILSASGPLFEIVDPVIAQDGNQLILNSSGEQVEISRATLVNGTPQFFDITGVQIQQARPIIPVQFQKIPVVQPFTINEAVTFLDINGNVVTMEQGQAGGNAVLRSQSGSLVYYASMVNDVYAYFLTGAKNGSILPRPLHFPTTQAQLDQVIAVGAPVGATFVDSIALAVELKSSWVEASTLPDPNDYITMTATIPTYDTTNPRNWVVNGQKTVLLAMVGMHFVGSTIGHPEMIWATFEHFLNTPNATYSYISNTGPVVTVPQNTAGYWLFGAPSAPAPYNIEHMRDSSGHIVVVPGFTSISASNTLREKSWGAASDQTPNPVDATPAQSNTEIISINNSVRGQLIPGDVRGNYIMNGATWTENGLIPTGSFPTGNEVGTSKLSNSTMETYQQGATTLFASGTNCFTCHTSTASPDGLADTAVSHIYGAIQPLVLTPGPKTPIIVVGTAVSKDPMQEQLRLFPNPANNLVNAQITVKNAGNAQIVIGDMNGKILVQRTSNLQAGDNFVELPVDGLTTGTYFIKVYKQDRSKALIGSFLKK
jgi:type IX secretion system substrate protein